MSHEEVRAILAEYEKLKQYFLDVEARGHELATAYESQLLASTALREAAEHPGSEVLLPLGHGILVRGSILGDKKVLVDVGSNVVIEKDPDSAINYIESRAKETQVAMEEVRRATQQIVTRMALLESEINRLTGQSQPGAQKNV